MKKEATFVQCYKVNTDQAPEVKAKYASEGGLVFKFYQDGAYQEAVAQEALAEQLTKVKQTLEKYDKASGWFYNREDGKVYQLKDLEEFDTAVKGAKEKPMVVCYHNGCAMQEEVFDSIKFSYENLVLYKVNTLNSPDIRDKYADGASKPYFKFYEKGEFKEYVKYSSSWEVQFQELRTALIKFNKAPPIYNHKSKVDQLPNLAAFNQASEFAGDKIFAVCFHNGCKTAEDGWDSMKSEYPNVHMYKVNTLNAGDIKDKYADGGSKPYFKFYNKQLELIQEVKYKTPWTSQEPEVRAAMHVHNGNKGVFYSSTIGQVTELKDLEHFEQAKESTEQKILAVCYHNGCPNEEAWWDKIKPWYPNLCLYKVNTLNAHDIKDKYADENAKPYFKFYKGGDLLNELKYSSDWAAQKVSLAKIMAKNNGGKEIQY